MKNLIFLYAGDDSTHAFDKVFSERSAFSRCIQWAKRIEGNAGIVIFSSVKNKPLIQNEFSEMGFDDAKIIEKEKWLCRDIIESMSSESSERRVENAVYACADRPFLNDELTREVLKCHEKYISEYTFADGYPYGFAPEVLNAGTLKILAELAKTNFRDAGEACVGNECIFNLLKKDINSFEIEAVIAPKDYRMLRFDFSCGTKRNLLACQRLYKKSGELSVVDMCDLAERSGGIQQTLPAFYNIQICSNLNSVPLYSAYAKCYKDKNGVFPVKKENPENKIMGIEKFSDLVSKISSFSEDAVIGLSAFCEPLLVENISDYVECVLKNKNLSVLIESDGTLVSRELASKIKSIEQKYGARENGEAPVIWILSIDAFSPLMYSKIVSGGSFEKAVESISILGEYFPDSVYPQFTRMNENEDELESFYRYWHEKKSPSNGKLIVQKYDDCCGLLPQRKPADLSPLERNVCWHIKRDLTVLVDGDVPLCRQHVLSHVIGNVFEDGLEKIWNETFPVVEEHIEKKYSEKCRKCDEYYTFNF